MIEKKKIDLEKVVLVGIITKDQNEDISKEYLDELEFLAKRNDWDVKSTPR